MGYLLALHLADDRTDVCKAVLQLAVAPGLSDDGVDPGVSACASRAWDNEGHTCIPALSVSVLACACGRGG